LRLDNHIRLRFHRDDWQKGPSKLKRCLAT
jgi:hypothetical protein